MEAEVGGRGWGVSRAISWNSTLHWNELGGGAGAGTGKRQSRGGSDDNRHQHGVLRNSAKRMENIKHGSSVLGLKNKA